MLDLVVTGAVKVSDAEYPFHASPTSQLFTNMPLTLRTGTTIYTQLGAMSYHVKRGNSVWVTDYLWFVTSQVTNSALITTWQWATLTGVSGVIGGTAIGFYFRVIHTPTYTGTITTLSLYSLSYDVVTDPGTGQPVEVYHEIFRADLTGLTISITQGSPFALEVTIAVGIAGWTVTATSGYSGTITTVTYSADFLRCASAYMIPRAVASFAVVTPRRYLATLTVVSSNYTLGVTVAGTTILYFANFRPSSTLTPGTLIYGGVDTLIVTFPSSSTVSFATSIGLVLSQTMTLSNTTTHYITLGISYSP